MMGQAFYRRRTDFTPKDLIQEDYFTYLQCLIGTELANLTRLWPSTSSGVQSPLSG